MSEMLFDLTGKTALVTGSYRGLGHTIARGLAEAGARVVLNGRDSDAVAAAVDQFRDGGLDAHGQAFDVTDAEAVAAGVAGITARVGSVDVLVNNAGINLRAPLEEMPEKTWRRVMDTDLTGPFLVARAVVGDGGRENPSRSAPHPARTGMIERGGGKIINICSLMSEVSRRTVAAYAAAKGALKMLTRAMAVEWAGFNIQVNGIGPGYFLTDMTRPLAEDPDFDAWLKRRTPAGRWGDPRELIGPTVFLASDASSFVNGHVLYVDGGLLASL